MNKIILGIIVVVVAVGGVVVFGTKKAETPSSVSLPNITDSVGAPSTLSAPVPTDEKRVVINGHKIQKGNITVPVGTTVVFENTDSFQGLPYTAHTITTGKVDSTGQSGVAGKIPNTGSGVPDGLIQAPLKKGDEYSYTFTDAGAVTFYVAEHPNVSGQGTVTIAAVEADSEKSAIQMESVSFSYAPNILNSTAGEQIDIDITSTGLHTFTIDELGIDISTPHGETTRVSFTPDKAGSYQYYCAIPGHTEAGQIGTLIVSEG